MRFLQDQIAKLEAHLARKPRDSQAWKKLAALCKRRDGSTTVLAMNQLLKLLYPAERAADYHPHPLLAALR
jgi:cytochrome c-type biogenesis protein CcmH/NrfG